MSEPASTPVTPGRLTRRRFLKVGAVGVAGLSLHHRPFVQGQGLAADDSLKKQPALDLYGDPLPAAAKLRLGSVRMRHSGSVSLVGFAAEGKELVSVGHDGTARVWDVATGKELRRISLPVGSGVGAIIFSPGSDGIVVYSERVADMYVTLTRDGSILAVTGSGGAAGIVVQLWDTAKGSELRRITLPTGLRTEQFMFSPDGKALASWGDDLVVHLVETATGKALRHLSAGADPNRPILFSHGGRPVAFSPDSKQLAIYVVERDQDNKATGTTITVYQADSGKMVRRIKVPLRWDPMRPYLCFTPDGKRLLLSSEGGSVYSWETDTGKEQRTLARDGDFSPILLAPDGRTFAVRDSREDPVSLCDSATGKRIRKVGVETHRSSGGIFSPGVWRGYSELQDVAYTPDGRTLAIGQANGAIRLWDVASGKEVRPTGGHQGGVTALAVAPDGKTLWSAAGDDSLRQWDLGTGKELRRLALPHGAGRAVFARDSTAVVFGAGDGTGNDNDNLHLGDLAAGKEKRIFTAKNGSGGCWAPAGAGLALSSTEHTIALRDYEGAMRLYDIAAGKELGMYSIKMPHQPTAVIRNGMMPGIAFTPDNSRLATADAGVIRLWDVAMGRQPFQFESRASDILTLAFSPDGWTLATTHADESISLWETSSGKERLRLKIKDALLPGMDNVLGNTKASPLLNCLAFSPDGRLLAAAGQDRRIHVWDVRSGRKLGMLAGHDGAIHCLAFLPDGRGIVSGSTDTTVLVYDLSDILSREQPAAEELAAERVAALWTELSGDDAGKAYTALVALGKTPRQTLPLVRARIKPVAVSSERVRQLLTDLDDNDFLVRQRATDELEGLGELVAADLQKVLEGKPSLEVHQRVERLLDRLLSGTAPPTAVLQALRSLELLEQIGSPEARQLVDALAGGASGARLTRAAKALQKRWPGK